MTIHLTPIGVSSGTRPKAPISSSSPKVMVGGRE
jgi:hypothetical protein